jgi:hypothetical protein
LPKLRAQVSQPGVSTDPSGGREAAIIRTVRTSLGSSLKGKRIVSVKIRQLEGNNVEGILKLKTEKGELQMVDFKAVAQEQDSLSSLELGGRRISISHIPETRHRA